MVVSERVVRKAWLRRECLEGEPYGTRERVLCNALRDLRCERGRYCPKFSHLFSMEVPLLEHKLPDSKASVLLFAPQLCKITEKKNGY